MTANRIFAAFALCTLVAGGAIAADAAKPERTVVANVITSAREPAVKLTLPPAAEYVGADRWVLYNIADCELHAWVEVDANKNVRRFYWVQFEGFIASEPQRKYEYDSPRREKLGGLEFYVDVGIRNKNEEVRAGGDTEHILALIRARGYKISPELLLVRLVHLTDATRRKELMYIYAEDISLTGRTAADFDEGGSAHAEWPAIKEALIKRAVVSLKVEPLAR